MLTGSPGPGHLRVEALGPLRAFAGDEEIDLGAPKQRAVFAVLALCADTTVSRADLVDRIWGESAPATAAGSLHTYLSGLRLALGPLRDLLVSDRAGYLLRLDRERFDVTRAEDQAERARAARDTADAVASYERALSNWTSGTLLAGVPGPFAEQARRRLAVLRVRLLVELAELAPPGLIPDAANRLIEEIPAHSLDEQLRTVTMTVLHRGGRTAEALAQYEDLRRRLAADLGITPSPAVQAAYVDILTDDRGRARRPAAGEPVRPAQLPPDRETFVGRAEELLSVVRGGSGGEQRRMVMIVGAGGIGKTALAVRAGHMLRESHPDGQIYLNLRGFDPSYAALTPDAALHQLLLSIGAQQIPPEREQRVALWRGLLAGRRLLIVLDNVRSSDQIEHLLPGAGSGLVIVTSRDRLSRLVVLHDANRIQLGTLSERESLRLLGAAIGDDRIRAEPEAARRLTQLCDHSPFALRIAAERLAPVAGAPIGGLVAQLENVQHRLDTLQMDEDPLYSVRAVLSWSFTALDAGAGRALRLLGVFPGPSVPADAAAALFGTDAASAGQLLDTLTARCLLEQDGDRFTMHDLTRVYAAERARELDKPQRLAALSRVLSWYRDMLDTERDHLLWCGAQWTNLVALIHAAGQSGQHAAAWELTIRLAGYFRAVGGPLDWLDLLRVAMRAAETAEDQRARAVLLHHGGLAHARLGQHKIAVRHLSRALELLAGPSDAALRIDLLGSLSTTLREMKDHQTARGFADEAIKLAYEVGADEHLAAALQARADLDAATGHHSEGLQHALAGLEHARAARRRPAESALLNTVGLARLGLGQRAAAGQAFAEALLISQDIGDRHQEGQALFGLARCEAPEAAADLARRALGRLAELDATRAAEVRAFLAGSDL